MATFDECNSPSTSSEAIQISNDTSRGGDDLRAISTGETGLLGGRHVGPRFGIALLKSGGERNRAESGNDTSQGGVELWADCLEKTGLGSVTSLQTKGHGPRWKGGERVGIGGNDVPGRNVEGGPNRGGSAKFLGCRRKSQRVGASLLARRAVQRSFPRRASRARKKRNSPARKARCGT